MEPLPLRREDLESLRSRAHDYFVAVDRPVASPELARVLFRRPRGQDSVSSLLVRTLLRWDDRFEELDPGTWQLVRSRFREQSLSQARFVVVDLEATGSDPSCDQVIEIGMVEVQDGTVCGRYQSLINPEVRIPSWIHRLTGIEDSTVEGAPRFHQIAPEVLRRLQDAVFVAHNVDFDYPFLRSQLRSEGFAPPPWPQVCTVRLARRVHPRLGSYRLDALAAHFGVGLARHHRAVDDAMAAARILLHLLGDLRGQGVDTVGQLLRLGSRA